MAATGTAKSVADDVAPRLREQAELRELRRLLEKYRDRVRYDPVLLTVVVVREP